MIGKLRGAMYGEIFTIRKYYFTCPPCGKRISMLLDLAASSQRYVEDCKVCCNPIEISFKAEEGRVVSFDAKVS
jgi:transcription elongation factor Elf1